MPLDLKGAPYRLMRGMEAQPGVEPGWKSLAGLNA